MKHIRLNLLLALVAICTALAAHGQDGNSIRDVLAGDAPTAAAWDDAGVVMTELTRAMNNLNRMAEKAVKRQLGADLEVADVIARLAGLPAKCAGEITRLTEFAEDTRNPWAWLAAHWADTWRTELDNLTVRARGLQAALAVPETEWPAAVETWKSKTLAELRAEQMEAAP